MSDDNPVTTPSGASPLAAFTTLRLGGPAAQLHAATTDDELVQIVRSSAVPPLILGGGSNVVIADAGVPGPVVLLRTRGLSVADNGDRVVLSVAAGEPWDATVHAAVAAGYSGLECLSGIPGAAGATPIQNVGAYGQEVAETISAVRVYDRVDDQLRTLTPAECGFGYRHSIFKHQDRYLVLGVDFQLYRSTLSAPIRYAELARALGVGVGDRVPLADARATVLRLRAGKGMVLDPDDPDTYSVGSFFMNPVLAEPALADLLARTDPADPPRVFPGPDGSAKVSAAWLIEHAGFGRGYSIGGDVALSSKHTLALTNRGNGSTTALLALARHIRDGVHQRFGVTLRPEPVLVNCTL